MQSTRHHLTHAQNFTIRSHSTDQVPCLCLASTCSDVSSRPPCFEIFRHGRSHVRNFPVLIYRFCARRVNATRESLFQKLARCNNANPLYKRTHRPKHGHARKGPNNHPRPTKNQGLIIESSERIICRRKNRHKRVTCTKHTQQRGLLDLKVARTVPRRSCNTKSYVCPPLRSSRQPTPEAQGEGGMQVAQLVGGIRQRGNIARLSQGGKGMEGARREALSRTKDAAPQGSTNQRGDQGESNKPDPSAAHQATPRSTMGAKMITEIIFETNLICNLSFSSQ